MSVDFVPTRMWFRLIELLPGILVVSAFGAIGVVAMVGLVVEALGGGYRDGLDWLKLGFLFLFSLPFVIVPFWIAGRSIELTFPTHLEFDPRSHTCTVRHGFLTSRRFSLGEISGTGLAIDDGAADLAVTFYLYLDENGLFGRRKRVPIFWGDSSAVTRGELRSACGPAHDGLSWALETARQRANGTSPRDL